MSEYYQFKEEDAEAFGRWVNASVKKKGKELIFRECPYCHARQDKEKFSINISTGQFQCKRASCGAKGNMLTLAKDFNFDLGQDVSNHYNLDKAIKYKRWQLPKQESKDEAIEYLASRGISEDTCRRYRITVKKDAPNILVFPFINEKSEMECIKYRKTDFDKSKDKNKEWFEKQSKPILFGMAQCEDYSRLIITEGQMDALALAEAGLKNTVSVPNGSNGFTWIPFCWSWINRFSEIVVFGDYEPTKSGTPTLIAEISKRFYSKKVYQVRLLDYCDCKDANEILQKRGAEALINAVNNAELIENDRIKNLANVKDVNVEELPAISTGIYEVDKILSGGFHEGQLIILTGKRGEGKSTFASMLMSKAIDQGIKSFLYSGELTNANAKNWLMQQLSGKKNAELSYLHRINSWINGQAYIYDMDSISDEQEDIPKIVEMAVCKYECKFIIIDNLMTAMSLTNQDYYLQQAEFVRKLKKLAQALGCVIILIAHPRKGQIDGTDNDAIAGSSNITDRADIVMTYQRVDPDDKPAGISVSSEEFPLLRMLSISKNRLTGRRALLSEAIPLRFNTDNRQITHWNDRNQVTFGWMSVGEVEEKEWTEISTEDIPEVIPF